MKTTLFFLTLFLMFTACKKVSKEDTTVEFQIIDASTQTGYANVKVAIYADSYKAKVTSELLWEGETDQEGKVKHTFKARTNYKIAYGFAADIQGISDKLNYELNVFSEPSPGAIKKDIDNVLVYNLLPYANVRLKYKNQNCQGVEDQIVLTPYFVNFPRVGFHGLSGEPQIGCLDLQTEYFRIYSGTYEYKCVSTKNNVDSVFYVNFEVEPEGYQDVEFLY
jgi:hypothetical protein